MRAPSKFRQRDVTAAVKAVEAAGHPVRRVKISHDGDIEVGRLGGVVYVFGFDHYVKIGFSRDFRRRRQALQEGLPRALDTYLIIPGGCFQTERELHARFAKYRLRGEWFLFAGDLADWIEQQRGVLSKRRVNRRAENLPEQRLEAIRRRNNNEWLDERRPPNPWDVVLEGST